MEVAFDETTKEVLFDDATGAVKESCCVEYGSNCSFCTAGKKPKYLTVILSGIQTVPPVCMTALDTCNPTAKYYPVVPEGVYVLTQTSNCIWEYANPTLFTGTKDTYGYICGTKLGTTTYTGLYIRVTRTSGSLWITVTSSPSSISGSTTAIADCANANIPFPANSEVEIVYCSSFPCYRYTLFFWGGQAQVYEGLC